VKPFKLVPKAFNIEFNPPEPPNSSSIVILFPVTSNINLFNKASTGLVFKLLITVFKLFILDNSVV